MTEIYGEERTVSNLDFHNLLECALARNLHVSGPDHVEIVIIDEEGHFMETVTTLTISDGQTTVLCRKSQIVIADSGGRVSIENTCIEVSTALGVYTVILLRF